MEMSRRPAKIRNAAMWCRHFNFRGTMTRMEVFAGEADWGVSATLCAFLESSSHQLLHARFCAEQRLCSPYRLMRINQFEAERREGGNGVIELLIVSSQSDTRTPTRFERHRFAELVLQFHDDAFGRYFPHATDLRK